MKIESESTWYGISKDYVTEDRSMKPSEKLKVYCHRISRGARKLIEHQIKNNTFLESSSSRMARGMSGQAGKADLPLGLIRWSTMDIVRWDVGPYNQVIR